ncbi:MAG TPA: alpha/beta hydrolase [Candidatus Caccomorpha excrementavium]|nr:alpha/beta hydrolase [Candidatus Caccomorpha excrementavium]
MDITLNVMERGSGKPLVLLHGNGESLEYFKSQIRYFSRSYRVIAVDTRGHGGSERGSAPFTLKQFAKDLKALLDTMGIRKISLLGFSDGGNIALIFALKYPDSVERLILNGANLNPFGMKASALIPIAFEYAAAVVKASGGSDALRHMTGGEDRKISAQKREAVRKKELFGLMIREPWIRPKHLQEISCPTLVIAGTKDMIRTSHTRLIAKRIRSVRLVLLRGDHFIAAERSRAFNRAVERFLRESEEEYDTGD